MADPDAFDGFEKELSALGGATAPSGADALESRPRDPWGVAAIVLGCIGIVAFGIVLCFVTGWVAAVAGAKARDEGRSLDNAYIGFALAALDGVVWIALHILFDIPFVAG